MNLMALGSGVPSAAEQSINEYENTSLNTYNYYFSKEFWKKNAPQVAKFASALAVAYLAPGVIGYAGGRLLGYYKTASTVKLAAVEIVQISNSSWGAILFGGPVRGTIGTLVVSAATSRLYRNLLCNDSTISYAVWKTNRLDIFRQNLMIPESFHEDEFLKEHICPINGFPVRYPVTHPFSDQIFEEGALLAWVSSHKSCPVTRQRIDVGDLTFNQELSQKIEERIAYLKENPAIVAEQQEKAKKEAIETRKLINAQQRERQQKLQEMQARQTQRVIQHYQQGNAQGLENHADQLLRYRQ